MPAVGIIVSAVFTTMLVLSQAAGAPGFSAFYNLVVGLSTMAAVVPYAFCALAPGLVAAHAAGGGPIARPSIVEIIGFVFAVFTIYGCGAQPVLYGTILWSSVSRFMSGSVVGREHLRNSLAGGQKLSAAGR